MSGLELSRVRHQLLAMLLFSRSMVHSHSSIFLLLPLGAGSRGVREYVTVLVTTCRTLILLVVLLSASVGEYVALQGVPLNADAL